MDTLNPNQMPPVQAPSLASNKKSNGPLIVSLIISLAEDESLGKKKGALAPLSG